MLLCQVKEEGWWLVLGDVDTHELLALKRISFADHTTARLTFPVINGAGREMAGVTLFFMSDSYLGLDQQYFVPVTGKQQSRRQVPTQTDAGQSQSSKPETGALDTPSSQQNGTGDVAHLTDTIEQMSLAEPDSQEPGVEHEAKTQRNNARRRRG